MPNIVDKINVGGQEYHLEPPMDAVPTQGSHNAVQSGGVYDALAGISISPTPAEGGVKAFSTGGAYSYLSELQKALGVTRVAVHNTSNVFSGIAAAYDRVFACEQPDNTKINIYYSTNYGYDFEKASSVAIPKGTLTGAVYFQGKYILSFESDATLSTSVNSLYYFVSDGSGFCTLPDGLEYANTRAFHIGANDTIAVAITINGIMWSEDGRNWNLSNISAAGHEHMLADGAPPLYAGGIWVCSCYGSVYISQDGKNWTEYPGVLGSPAYQILDISYAHGLWYCVGPQSKVYWSEDAVHWTDTGTTTYSPAYSACNSVAVYCNNKYILSNGMMSDNGKTEWVSSGMPLAITKNIVKNKYGLIACISDRYIAWSKDCLTWEISGNEVLYDISSPARGAYAVGLLDNGDIASLINHGGSSKFGYICISKSPILPDITA